MRIIVLTDNISCGDIKGEWGLSLYIEYNGKSLLLDTGASDTFITNAGKLGIDIANVDCAVLSHAHYDHTGGLAAFLQINKNAPVYLSPNAGENCYAGWKFLSRYIGMPKGLTERFPKRIIRPVGVFSITEGVYLVPHSTEGLSRLGKRNHLYVRRGIRFIPDDFSHEQTLVFKTTSGLVLINSCSHSGPEVIVNEVREAFPGENIAVYVGGLHLFRLRTEEVVAVSEKLASCGIGKIYTGHCTGQNAYDILRERFGGKIEQLHCGMQIEYAVAVDTHPIRTTTAGEFPQACILNLPAH